MAIYHLCVKIIGRNSCKSAVAAAAYRAADRLQITSVAAAAYRSGGELQETHSRRTYDYTIKTGVVYTEILLPENAPEEYSDRSTLWNAVEESEKRKDAQTAREVEVALPVEFTLQEQTELLREYITENFVDKGMCADFAIHDKKDGNPHAHIMLTTRHVTESGFGGKNREWNDKAHLEAWREQWAIACNERLQAKGLDIQIDHRTLEAQGFEREPTIHVGRSPEREKQNQEIMKRNERYLPANVVRHMNSLQEKYKAIDGKLTECAKKQREADRLTYRIKDMEKRAIEITKKRTELAEAMLERESMKFLQSKKEINSKIDNLTNSERNARNFFVRAFGIEFDNVSVEIQKIEAQKETISKDIRAANVEELSDERNKIVMEYQKQKLLAKIRPDGEEILSRIKPPPSELGSISEASFKRIVPELRPAQVRILNDQRKEAFSTGRIYEWTR